MNSKALIDMLTKGLAKTKFIFAKHGPAIMVYAGAAGTIAGTVLACKATRKLDGIIDEAKKEVKSIHEASSSPEFKDKYTEEDAKKDLRTVYLKTGAKIAKLYAPAAVVEVASIGSILTSHTVMTKRNAAITAAYTALDASYKAYRSSVKEKYGEDVDGEIRYSTKAKEVIEVDAESGETKTMIEKNINGDNIFFFDESSVYWTRDPWYNKALLKSKLDVANRKLRGQGYLFVNDVLELVGLQCEKKKSGQCLGWTWDAKKDPFNKISFGLEDFSVPKRREFDLGEEPSVMLEFNVDGNILYCGKL